MALLLGLAHHQISFVFMTSSMRGHFSFYFISQYLPSESRSDVLVLYYSERHRY